MHLLPAPYGYQHNGHHISLRSESRKFDDRTVIGILKSYSCYPAAIPKIISSLHHGGRYDCVIAAGWFREQWPFVTDELAEYGIDLIILESCPNYPLANREDCRDSEEKKRFKKQIREV